MQSILIKYKDKFGKLITSSNSFVVITINGKEQVVKSKDDDLYCLIELPCPDCNYGCYNYQMRDCKDYCGFVKYKDLETFKSSDIERLLINDFQETIKEINKYG